jgi:hypothetical protein
MCANTEPIPTQAELQTQELPVIVVAREPPPQVWHRMRSWTSKRDLHALLAAISSICNAKPTKVKVQTTTTGNKEVCPLL